MEKKFSKGKWEVTDDTGECFMIESEDGGLICTVHDGSFDDDAIHMDVVEANAKLIAAAPYLLDRLNKLVLSVKAHPDYVNGEECDEWHDIIDLAEETIKKATE